jgi:hypothetical protein
MSYGKLVAMVGVGVIVLKPLVGVFGWSIPEVIYFVGVAIIIIGAIIHVIERQ